MTIQEQTVINAPTEQVFSYISDPQNRPELIPLLDEVILLDDQQFGLGSKYIEVATIAGRKFRTTYLVVAFEENKQISVITRESVFPIRVDLTLGVNGNQTEIRIVLNLKLSGIYALASPVIRAIVVQQSRDILSRMKKRLEQ